VNLDDGTVATVDDPVTTVSGVHVAPDLEPNECGIVIDQLTLELLGEWTCGFNEDVDELTYRRAIFQLRLSESGYLTEGMRLPKYIIPKNYDIVRRESAFRLILLTFRA